MRQNPGPAELSPQQDEVTVRLSGGAHQAASGQGPPEDGVTVLVPGAVLAPAPKPRGCRGRRNTGLRRRQRQPQAAAAPRRRANGCSPGRRWPAGAPCITAGHPAAGRGISTPTRPTARWLPGRGARRYPSRLGAPTPVRGIHDPAHGRPLRRVMARCAVGAWRITQPMCDGSVSRSQLTATDSQCPRKPARLKAPARRSPPIPSPCSQTQPGTTLRHV